MFISKKIQFVEVELGNTGDIEVQCISVQGLRFMNVYLPPKTKSLSNVFFSHGLTRSLIVGDLKAHHPLWGSEYTNNFGNILHDIFDKNFVLLNIDEITRIDISRPGRGSILDLTVSSSDIAHKISTEVTGHLLGNDHFIVQTTLDFNVARSGGHIPSWSLRRANWPRFKQLCTNFIPPSSNNNLDNGESVVRNFTNALI